MTQMGAIYRHLQQQYGDDLEIDMIDPRNSISFFAILVREKRNRNVSWRSFLRTALFGLSKHSIVINGQLLSKGELPSIEQIDRKIRSIQQRVS